MDLQRRNVLKMGAIGAAGYVLGNLSSRGFAGEPAGGSGRATGNDVAEWTPERVEFAAASSGIMYGVAIQSDKRTSKPGPGGRGTLADFIRDHAALYVPGIAFLPDHIQPKKGVFTLDMANAFIRRAKDDNKAFRIHCLLYPGHDAPWVKDTLNPTNWRTKIDAHFEAIASVPGVQDALNFDVVNELMEATQVDTDGYRPNSWYRAAGGPDYVPYAFKKARELFPGKPLYWCHDHTEQITDGYHVKQSAYVLAGLERAMKAGAPIDGYNMQGHLQLRLGFDEKKLRSFLNDITGNLGLKLIIGELDCRTGYIIGKQTDTRPPEDYDPSDYDQRTADLTKRFLDVVLPYVKQGGRQVLSWGISDVDHSWEPGTPQDVPVGERPLPYDAAYQPKPVHTAIYDAFRDLAA